MFKRVDQSPRIARLLENLSAGLAKRRGLPIVIGIGLIILAFIAALFNLIAPAPFWQCVWVFALHIGLIAALIGVVMSEPLGR
jgi:hypothetical protein